MRQKLTEIKDRAYMKALAWFFMLQAWTEKFDQKLWGEERASRVMKASYAELGIFAVLVFGAIALIVVSITLLFGMQIAGEFEQGIDVDNAYSDEANETTNQTGTAFELFGTAVLVIPAASVLAVLVGGMVGAVAMAGRGGGMGLPGGRRRGGLR